MIVTFTPMRRNDRLALSVAGDVLTLNGEVFDFTALPEGATLPRTAVACDWLVSDITRSGGEIAMSVILPHGAHAPKQTLFPEPITLSVDGPVTLPSYQSEEAEV